MRLDQKLRVITEQTSNFEIVVVDDTGFSNQYNPLGYRDNLEKVSKYFFVLNDLIRHNEFIFVKEETEPIQYGVPMRLEPKHLGTGVVSFKDSLYSLSMYTKFDIQLEGDGFKGLEFISNVAGASVIKGNYSAIIDGENVYRIVDVEGDTIYLDKPLKEDVTEFKLGFYDEVSLVLYTDIQESLIRATERLTDCCGEDTELINLLASAHLYLKGVKEAESRGSYESALKFLEFAKSASRRLKDCSGC